MVILIVFQFFHEVIRSVHLKISILRLISLPYSNGHVVTFNIVITTPFTDVIMLSTYLCSLLYISMIMCINLLRLYYIILYFGSFSLILSRVFHT